MHLHTTKASNFLKGCLLFTLLLAVLPACIATNKTGAMSIPATRGVYVLEITPGDNNAAIRAASSTGVLCKGVLKDVTRPKGSDCLGQMGEIILECSNKTFVVADWMAETCVSGIAYGITNEGNEVYIATGGDLESQKSGLLKIVKTIKELKRKLQDAEGQSPQPGAFTTSATPSTGFGERSTSGGYSNKVVSGNEKAVLPRILPGGVGAPAPSRIGGSGTGFFVSRDGLIVTSAHVVRGARAIGVANSQTQELVAAKVLVVDTANDLAVLKANVQSSPMPLASSFNSQKGEEVLTLGYPLLTVQGSEQKATFGRVNAFSGIEGDIRFAQVDLPLQPGNSGGPLLNNKGEVIGVVTSTLAGNKIGVAVQNVNYAVKVDYLYPLLKSVGAEINTSPQAQKKTFPNIVSLREHAVVVVIVQ